MLLIEAVDAYLSMTQGPHVLSEDTPEIQIAFHQAITGKNPAAFATLFRHYYPTLMKVARARARSAEDAEDALQAVMLKIAAGKLSHYNVTTPQGVTGLLVRIVGNEARSHGRVTKKHKGVVAVGGQQDATGETQYDPEAPVATGLTGDEKKIVREAVARALETSKLSEKERAFITKFVGTGEDLKDIALVGGEHGAWAKLAGEFWPEMKDKTRQIHAKRVKERFLKSFCQDKELQALLPTGHARKAASSAFRSMQGTFTAACESDTSEQEGANTSADAVIRFIATSYD